MLSALTMQFSRPISAAPIRGGELEVDDLVQAYFVRLINARYGEIIDVGAREYAKDFTLRPSFDHLLAFYLIAALGKKLVASQGSSTPSSRSRARSSRKVSPYEAIQKMAPEMKNAAWCCRK